MAVSLSILPRPFAICPSGGDQKGCRSLPFNSQTNKQKLASEEENEVEESRTPVLGSFSKLNKTSFANHLLMNITAMVNFLLQSLIVPTSGICCQLKFPAAMALC
jgi:hypothetical protein